MPEDVSNATSHLIMEESAEMRRERLAGRRVNVVLSPGSRPNFLLTRSEALRQAAKRLGWRVRFLDVSEAADLAGVCDEVIWLPYVDYASIPPSVYSSFRNGNKVIVTGGDEVLGAELRPLSYMAADIYVVFDSRMYGMWRPLLGGHLICMPEGYWPQPHDPTPKQDKAVYIGSPYLGRVSILRQLAAAGIPLEIYGPKGWATTPLASLYKGYIDNDQYYKTIAASKIFLALSSGDVAFDPHPNAKLGDALRAGTICLTEDAELLRSDFSAASDAVLGCASVGQMIDRARAIFSLDPERYATQIEQARRSTASSNLNYLVSMAELLAATENSSGTATAIANGPPSLSLTLRAMRRFGLLRIEEAMLAALAHCIKDVPAKTGRYIAVTSTISLFRRERRLPERLSVLVFDRKTQCYKLRPRWVADNTTPSPDLKAVTFGIPSLARTHVRRIAK